MKYFQVKIEKCTNELLMQKACEMTFLGKSKLALKRAYKSEHTIIYTQLFWIELHDIPLFASTQLLRHKVGNTPFQVSCREDRKGCNVNLKDKLNKLAKDSINLGEVDTEQIEELYSSVDRYTPVKLGMFINAKALISMSNKRLCRLASKETTTIFKGIIEALKHVDNDLVPFLVPTCIYRGGICPELQSCKFNQTKQFDKELTEYKELFK